MADYTPDELNNGTTSSVNLTAGSTNTFTFTTEAVNSYFTLETTRNSNGIYDSNSPTNLSGSIENLVNVPSIIHDDDYIAGFVLGEGTSSFDFIPSEEITGALFNLRTAGSIYLSLVGGGGINPLWNGLVAYYTADNTPNDATGNGNDLTLVNGVSYVTGIINQGFNFDGVNDYAQAPIRNGFNNLDSFTLSCWALTASGNRILLTSNSNSSNGPSLAYWNSKLSLFKGNGALTQASSILSLNQWYYFTITHLPYDGVTSNVFFYINGVADGNTIYNIGSTKSPSLQYVGCYSPAIARHNGFIDEIGIWERALDSTEVAELYNSGSGLQYPN